jgi:hypothetical protein
MKLSTGKLSLLFLAAALHFVCDLGAGPTFIVLVNSTEISEGSYIVNTKVNNTGIKVESTEFSTHFNPLSSLRKHVKNSIIPFSSIKLHGAGHFNQYNFGVKNLLIHYGRKAIYYPFQYFW